MSFGLCNLYLSKIYPCNPELRNPILVDTTWNMVPVYHIRNHILNPERNLNIPSYVIWMFGFT